MKRVLVILFVGVFFLVPATSWSGSPFDTGNLVDRVAQLEALVATLQAQLSAESNSRIDTDSILKTLITKGDASTLRNANAYTDSAMPDVNDLVPNLGNYVSVDTSNNRITFTGANLQIVNGTRSTHTPNALGNLIIGYDLLTDPLVKTGSHNLVIGDFHRYSSTGGLVVGTANTISNGGTTVLGGYNNTASGNHSVVSGGDGNEASGDFSVVSGGVENVASERFSTVSGGWNNTASGIKSVVSGGAGNTASGENVHVP